MEKFCMAPESFATPAPLIVKVLPAPVVILNELVAAELKTISATSVKLVERATSVLLERPNVATSAGPLGMVCGVQFAAVFQSPLVGFSFQVALSAEAAFRIPSERVRMIAHETMGAFMAAIMPMALFKRQADSPPPYVEGR